MNSVFADAFYFFALINRADVAHHKAKAYGRTAQARLVTTSWVLTELADGLAASQSRQKFVELLQQLRTSDDVEVLPFSAARFEAGIDLYARRTDKNWSLTDCISFVVMRERGLTDALTGDRHFEQAGFNVLLKG